MRALLSLALAAAACSAAPAAACTVWRDYHLPNGLELAERADLIVVAQVTGAQRPGPYDEPLLSVQPLLTLKGTPDGDPLEIPGWLEGSPDAGDMQATRSDPLELTRPNPDALKGGCVRYLFAPGMKLLLFYERNKGKLDVAIYPFARVSEDVTDLEAPWVRLVQFYVRVAALPPRKRTKALKAERSRLRALDGAENLAMADAIGRILSGDTNL